MFSTRLVQILYIFGSVLFAIRSPCMICAVHAKKYSSVDLADTLFLE